ncbi:flavodoxin family protein [Maridesulfovibrio bastinii]|uniref:flavodoxin family protein n=1 Tax=Maridesulfovibrio bastinii TaxID=47157 RepID=UPI0003FDF9CB|nr:flavodoxin family protein [Maridesulfovibrio bastinii]
MKYYAINGSPRKKWNTAQMLQKSLDGIKSVDASNEVELIHLYELNFKPCMSCFLCKKIDGKSYGKCGYKDELSPVLEKLATADGIIFGSPIYLGSTSGYMRSFLERLLFQYLVYDKEKSSLAPKRMPTAFIYTMNVTKEIMNEFKYPERLGVMDNFIGRILTDPEVLYVNNTMQFTDYSKYKTDAFSEKDKRAYREKYYDADCEKAFNLGISMCKK